MQTSAGVIECAAVQIAAEPGRLQANLQQVEQLAREAFQTGARLVALPEFFTSSLITGAPTAEAVLPAGDNDALDLLKALAREYQGVIGGSFLVAEQGEIYNRYHLVEADGSVHMHDKDLPTMWENAFYTGGQDDGVFDTGLGGIGAAVCWELIRYQTVARMRGRVALAMTGTHWWTMPANWPVIRDLLGPLSQYNRYLSEQAPVEFARLLGAPVLQASHCGEIQGAFHLLPRPNVRLRYATHFVGATQIVDAAGHVLASRSTADGPGIVRAAITPQSRSPVRAAEPGRFWIPRLPAFLQAYWHHQNWVGRGLYARGGREAGLRAAADHAAGGQPGR